MAQQELRPPAQPNETTMKTSELREMSDEQVRLTWKEASENLFRLRLQAQTERLDAPSELRRHRRLIAQCQTILNERGRAAVSQKA
jgi:large subunit ribosomal protein L29